MPDSIRMRGCHSGDIGPYDNDPMTRVGDFMWAGRYQNDVNLVVTLPYERHPGFKVWTIQVSLHPRDPDTLRWNGDSYNPTIRGEIKVPGWSGYIKNGEIHIISIERSQSLSRLK